MTEIEKIMNSGKLYKVMGLTCKDPHYCLLMTRRFLLGMMR